MGFRLSLVLKPRSRSVGRRNLNRDVSTTCSRLRMKRAIGHTLSTPSTKTSLTLSWATQENGRTTSLVCRILQSTTHVSITSSRRFTSGVFICPLRFFFMVHRSQVPGCGIQSLKVLGITGHGNAIEDMSRMQFHARFQSQGIGQSRYVQTWFFALGRIPGWRMTRGTTSRFGSSCQFQLAVMAQRMSQKKCSSYCLTRLLGYHASMAQRMSQKICSNCCSSRQLGSLASMAQRGFLKTGANGCSVHQSERTSQNT